VPLTLTVELGKSAPKGSAIGVGVFQGKNGVEVPASVSVSATSLVARGFEGKVGQTIAIPGKAANTILVGLGSQSALTIDQFRHASAMLARAATSEKGLATAIIDQVPAKIDRAAAGQAFAEGALLATYQFNGYRSAPAERALKRIVLTGRGGRLVANGLDIGRIIAEAVSMNRDLVNEPPSDLPPHRLAEIAMDIADNNGVQCVVWDESDIQRERLGGILGVARGSDQPPRMIKMTYTPKNARGRIPTIALVGKGITFDSGGLSLKPSDSMITMKSDMSGAGLVVSIMSVLSRLEPKCRVVGYCCVSENMTGGAAYKLGDVLTARNGKTVEIHNTDAEGRLVLMDGLSLAAEDKVDAIVDIATLTGAQIVALGAECVAVMGNHSGFTNQIINASKRVGEDTWELPLIAKYRKHLDSSIADMKNIGTAGQAGSIVAGLFLQEFVAGKPWVHLDIAGPSFSNAEDGIFTKGGTGSMVRTLIETIRSFSTPK
jgi:leucyl aminopeptidase